MSLALVKVNKSNRIVNEQYISFIQPVQLHFHPLPLLVVADRLCIHPELF